MTDTKRDTAPVAPALLPAFALCTGCLQLSIWYTESGELPQDKRLYCRWCDQELDRIRHKARRPDGPHWAQ